MNLLGMIGFGWNPGACFLWMGNSAPLTRRI
jgi:hypothetical protein